MEPSKNNKGKSNISTVLAVKFVKLNNYSV